MTKTAITSLAFALALTGGVLAQGNSGNGNNSNSEGLVNVTLGDVVISQIAQDLNVEVSQIPVTVQVPVGVAANVCGIAANVLASSKKDAAGASCEAATSSQALQQIVQRSLTNQQ